MQPSSHEHELTQGLLMTVQNSVQLYGCTQFGPYKDKGPHCEKKIRVRSLIDRSCTGILSPIRDLSP